MLPVEEKSYTKKHISWTLLKTDTMTVSGDTEVRRSTAFTENLTSQYNKNMSILQISQQRASEIIKN